MNLKKSFVLALLIPASVLFAQKAPNTMKKTGVSSKTLTARCLEAMGGMSSINNLQALRWNAVYPDHGAQPIALEIKRPHFSRNPRALLVFDGTHACFLKGEKRDAGPQMFDSGDLPDFEVEIAQIIPAYFEFPAIYTGTEKSGENEIHLLQVKLPLGAMVTYSIDGNTYLPVRIAADYIFRGKKMHMERSLSEYKKVGGVMFPHRFTYESRNGIQQGWTHSIEINPVFAPGNFSIPADAK